MLGVIRVAHGLLLVCAPPPSPPSASDVESELIKIVNTVRMGTPLLIKDTVTGICQSATLASHESRRPGSVL